MLKLNDDKTELIFIKTPRGVNLPDNTASIRIGETVVKSSASAKNLGVTLDEMVSMDQHISGVCRSAFIQLRYLFQIRSYLPHDSLQTLVHAFITSKLDYCNSLLLGIPANRIKKLQLIQNTAARLVSGSPRYASATPLLKQLHWLPVQQRIQFKTLLLCYKCLNNLAPLYLCELIAAYKPVRTLRSIESNLVVVPRANTARYGNRAFSLAAPMLWNALPAEIRAAKSIAIFKSKLKTHLFGRS